jgi:AcrR family transcriptional regulator
MSNRNHSASTRALLLDTGMQIARETGLRKLTVRGLATRAGVNPGGFVYHFGNRETFVSALIETWYQPLFARLQLHADQSGSPLQRLRTMLLQLFDFALEHRAFVAQLLQDAAAGELAVCQFVRSMNQRHPQLLLSAVRDAQQAGELLPAHPVQILLFIMPPLGGPLLWAEIGSHLTMLPQEWVALCARFAHDRDAIAERLDWALKGVSQPGELRCE